jgi:L-lactate utilization protein LutB
MAIKEYWEKRQKALRAEADELKELRNKETDPQVRNDILTRLEHALSEWNTACEAASKF